MPRIIDGYPFTVVLDAFRSSLMAVLGVFIAIYLGTLLAILALGEDLEWGLLAAAPILAPFGWIMLLAEAWAWCPTLALAGILLAYMYLPHFRFELILTASVVLMAFGVFAVEDRPPEAMPRMAIAAAGTAILIAAATWLRPWRDRDPSA